MINIYANVGKIGNLAQSLLLIEHKNTPFLQTSYLNNNAKPLTDNVLREELRSSKSAFFCFFLLFSAQNLHTCRIPVPPIPYPYFRTSQLALFFPHNLSFISYFVPRTSYFSCLILHPASCILHPVPAPQGPDGQLFICHGISLLLYSPSIQPETSAREGTS